MEVCATFEEQSSINCGGAGWSTSIGTGACLATGDGGGATTGGGCDGGLTTAANGERFGAGIRCDSTAAGRFVGGAAAGDGFGAC